MTLFPSIWLFCAACGFAALYCVRMFSELQLSWTWTEEAEGECSLWKNQFLVMVIGMLKYLVVMKDKCRIGMPMKHR